jgi:hypothetical protein
LFRKPFVNYMSNGKIILELDKDTFTAPDAKWLELENKMEMHKIGH